jgi:hypothetical protein
MLLLYLFFSFSILLRYYFCDYYQNLFNKNSFITIWIHKLAVLFTHAVTTHHLIVYAFGLFHHKVFLLVFIREKEAGVRTLAEAKDFSSSLYVQTSSEAHPASCTMGTGGPFPGDKARPGRGADHHTPI